MDGFPLPLKEASLSVAYDVRLDWLQPASLASAHVTAQPLIGYS